MSSFTVARSVLAAKAAKTTPARRSVRARCAPESPVEVPPAAETAEAPAAEEVAAPAAAVAAPKSFLMESQELVNGRAAQVGFLAAVGVEVFGSGASLPQQLFTATTTAGVESTGFNGLGFMCLGFTAAMVTMGTLAPGLLMEEGKPVGKGFGPFQKDAEVANGRAAMMGFLTLFIVESVKGSALF